MKRKIVLLSIFLIAGMIDMVNAQSDDVNYYSAPIKKDTSKMFNDDWLYNVSAGGNFGLQLGTYTFIECSPHLAYHVTDWFAAGIGGTYMFYRVQNSISSVNSTHIFGGSVFAEAYFLKFLGAHVEYQFINYDNFWIQSVLEPSRLWSNNLLLGGGYYQKMSERSAIYLMILYNFTDRPEKNVLFSPVMKAGFTIWLK